MTRAAFAAAALVACAATPALAHEIPVNTGEGLLRNCTLKDDGAGEVEHHLGLCLGFVKGVTNTLAAQRQLKVCPPATLGNDDLLMAVVSRMKLLPADLMRESSAIIVQTALEDAFRCS